jgi:pantoate--beta-alanine ligase
VEQIESERMKFVKKASMMTRLIREQRRKGMIIGLVPTLGCLHEGHGALIKKARKECGVVAVSIFVNPIQFRQKAFNAYPRTMDQDWAFCEQLGIDFLFAPSVGEMYPEGFDTTVEIGDLVDRLEGKKIRWHYKGVTTVVAKLFNICDPDRAYFGKKDAHQLAILTRMTRDLSFPVKIIGVPTKRAKDGVALSSRNTKLTPEQRVAARAIPDAMGIVAARIASGEQDREVLAKLLIASIESTPDVTVDFAAVVDAVSLREEDTASGKTMIYVAAFVGPWRLTDNQVVKSNG